MLIDSHCHLDHWREEEIAGVVARAGAAGVRTLITIGTRIAQAPTVKRIAETFPDVWCTVGIHPHQAAEAPIPAVEEFVALADHPKVVGIGEAGLDYHYDRAPRDIAAEVFRRQIRAARITGLPLVIHARDADDDIAAILKDEREGGGAFPFVLHCFSSGRALAETGVARIAAAGKYASCFRRTALRDRRRAQRALWRPTEAGRAPTRELSLWRQPPRRPRAEVRHHQG